MTHPRLIIIAVCVGTGCAGVAQAQWAVIDAGNIVQTTATAASTLQTMYNTYTQIDKLTEQIDNERQTLESLDPRSITGLKQLLDEGQITYRMLSTDLNAIGYSVKDVNNNFSRLFPKDQTQWKAMKYSDFDGRYDGWHREITSASLAATRAQTSVAALDRNNKSIIDILEASKGAAGEVRQLQLVNQQLALIHAALISVVQNLATTGRVMTDMAAASVGEKMANREAARRRTENYTSRGAPPQRLQRFP